MLFPLLSINRSDFSLLSINAILALLRLLTILDNFIPIFWINNDWVNNQDIVLENQFCIKNANLPIIEFESEHPYAHHQEAPVARQVYYRRYVLHRHRLEHSFQRSLECVWELGYENQADKLVGARQYLFIIRVNCEDILDQYRQH